MKTRDFGMGFFERTPFGTDEKKDFFKKWSKMTDEEKIELMNKRMETMNNDEHDGFFGKREFTVADIDQRYEEWLKKTPEEKEAFVKERKEVISNFRDHGRFFERGRGFGFDGNDRRENCMHDFRGQWSKMTDEEKKEFIRKREEAMNHCGNFFELRFSVVKEPQTAK